MIDTVHQLPCAKHAKANIPVSFAMAAIAESAPSHQAARRMSTGGTDLGNEILAAARNGCIDDIRMLLTLGASINTQVCV